MPVTAADLKFFASKLMSDAADSGGPRSSALLQSGVTGDVFSVISSNGRLLGESNVRKFYPSITNADTSPGLGVTSVFNEVPTDPAISGYFFSTGDATTTRTQAIAALQAAGDKFETGLDAVPAAWYVPAGGDGTQLRRSGTPLGAGEVVVVPNAGLAVNADWPVSYIVSMGTGTVVAGAIHGYTVSPALPANGTGSDIYYQVSYLGTTAPSGLRVYGAATINHAVGSGDVNLRATTRGALRGSFLTSAEDRRLRTIAAGDVITLWHEEGTTPGTRANGDVVNVGRTNLDQIALIDAAGREVARFLAGGPTPAGGAATADLAAGTLTVVSITGLTQPLHVRHRISHRSAVAGTAGPWIKLGTATTRAFPTGSVVSSHLPHGDLQARALTPYGQQTWTRVWSDTLIGNPAPLQYAGAITVTNQGAETDRYVIDFTSATAFTAYSELLGVLGSGTTAANFSPLNPATGAPLFTLLAASWLGGILVRSCMRFNTVAAAASVFGVRVVKPSTPTGLVRTAFRLHCSV